MPKAAPQPDTVSVVRNRRARHDYHILETWEAGLVLTGTEVKALRDGKANLADSFAQIRDGEAFLFNMHVSPYAKGGVNNHEPTRTRKLLLHRREIRKLIGSIERQGLTVVPLEVYFRKGIAKVKLALVKGKKLHDKRETERRRDAERDIARALRTR